MIRRVLIERIRRQIYNGQPSADATITVNLVNIYLNEALAIAARKNYTDNLQLDGIAYVNGAFYTTFKNLSITKDELFLFKTTLPQMPVGVGADEGINTCILTDNTNNTYPIVWLTQNQKSYSRSMRPIPNKILGYSESKYIYMYSVLPLSMFTAKVTMISGGDSSNLDSELNIPDDYLPIVNEYILKQLLVEKAQPLDATNDGMDAIKTT